MIAAVLISVVVMLLAAEPVGEFIDRHPTVKMLALSFLLLVGVALIADGLHFHIPRGYLYFAIAFSIGGGDAEPVCRPRPGAAAGDKGGGGRLRPRLPRLPAAARRRARGYFDSRNSERWLAISRNTFFSSAADGA